MSFDEIVLSLLTKARKSRSAFSKIFLLTRSIEKPKVSGFTIISNARLQELMLKEKRYAEVNDVAKEMLIFYRNNEKKK